MARLSHIAVLLATACTTTKVAKFGAPATPMAAVNPLGGDPLSVSVPGTPEVEALQKENCNLWPLFDTFRLTADPAQVCVTAVMYLLSTEAGPDAVEFMELGLANAPRPSTTLRLSSAGMHKVARCYGTDRLRTSVWSFQFVGCTPNDHMVMGSTHTLVLRRQRGLASAEGAELARWTFASGQPAPVASPGTTAGPSAELRTGFESPPLVSADGPPVPVRQPPAPVARQAPPPPVHVPPEQSRVFYQQGAQFLAAQRYAEALDRFSRCLDLDPALSQGYVARGNALLGLRRYAEAGADYAYALELNPRSALPLYGLAEAARGQNDVRRARTYYQRFLDSSLPDATEALKQAVSSKLSALR